MSTKAKRREVWRLADLVWEQFAAGQDVRYAFPKLPTWVSEQLDGAVDDAGTRITSAVEIMGWGSAALSNPRGRLSRALWRFIFETGAGLTEMCDHIGNAPMVVYASLWEGKFRCANCFMVPRPRLPRRQDFTCDACHRYHDADCRQVVVHMGPVLLSCGLCSGCFEEAARR